MGVSETSSIFESLALRHVHPVLTVPFPPSGTHYQQHPRLLLLFIAFTKDGFIINKHFFKCNRKFMILSTPEFHPHLVNNIQKFGQD